MEKCERVDAAVAGRPVDRPPVAAWRHFVGQEANAPDLARAMVGWLREFDWDFLKINPRWTYVVEAWGNKFDMTHYQGVSPTPVSHVVQKPGDLSRITPLDPAAGALGEQIDAVSRICRELGGEVYAVQTVFSPLSYLSRLAGATAVQEGSDSATHRIRHLVAADEAAVHGALDAIATTLAGYVREVLRAGASGIFFADVKNAREGQLTREEVRRLSRPYDLKVLGAAQGASFNVLHLCGDGIYLDEYADFPVHVVNWDVLGHGNPTLARAKETVPFAVAGATGESGTLQTGTPEEVTVLVRQAIESTGGLRMMVCPGCSAKPPQSVPNLRAFRQAVEVG